jgi:hypothetical protein
MGQEPLVVEETDAGGELIRRLDKHVPVKVAFWVKLSEEGQWYLYIASDQINDHNVDVAYGKVLQLADEMGSVYLDPFRVKLIPTDDPLAQAAVDVHRRYPRPIATRLGAKDFGGTAVDGVFIYPDSITSLAP